MARLPILFFVLMLSNSAHAQKVSESVIDSCLMFDKPVDASVVISPLENRAPLIDEVTVPGYQLFIPASDNNDFRVGYATSQRGIDDYVFVDSHRGYIKRAVAVGKFQTKRIEQPSLASFALLRQHGQLYLCVMESNGNGSAAFVRSAFVGRIPASKSSSLKLFYKVADVKKLDAFNRAKR